jgi:integrase
MAGRHGKRSFGAIRKLPSGRYQASYIGPDTVRHTGPTTFEAKIDAEEWLAARRREILGDDWQPPKPRRTPPLEDYAEQWLDGRDLKRRSHQKYRGLLDVHILPDLGEHPLHTINREAVREWWAALDTGPAAKADAYNLLRGILNSAVDDELIAANPCRIKSAGVKRRSKVIRVATLDELETIVENMPDQLRALVLLAAWCGLRFGELAGLTRADLDVKARTVRVTVGVGREGGELFTDTPKSAAGVRTVHIPPHILPPLRRHLRDHVGPHSGALLFANREGSWLAHSTMDKALKRAVKKAGRPDLTLHDLRHTGATLAGRVGATGAELQARLGHSTAAMTNHYQHAADERDAEIAKRLSKLAKPKTSKTSKKSKKSKK